MELVSGEQHSFLSMIEICHVFRPTGRIFLFHRTLPFSWWNNRNVVVVIRERYANRVSLFSIHNSNGFEEDIDGVLEKVVRVAEELEIAVNPVLKEANLSDDMGAQPVETKTLCFR
ncbi:hypothetical protein OUZ56_006289 [Daphnia magna]|uniref:Uncharacterized protein n=1 Tax=Daphnia magna TaxID=35525 RepID=A0ABQ9YVD9_9CRUS|nr:hypothetical protein OUZ56_006289 [Daphnia magna]